MNSNDKSIIANKHDTTVLSLDREKGELEKIKARQKMEIQNMIEYEIKMELIKKSNEDKLLKQQQKEEHMKQELINKQKEQEESKKKKEKDKEFALKKEMELQEKLKHDKF